MHDWMPYRWATKWVKQLFVATPSLRWLPERRSLHCSQSFGWSNYSPGYCFGAAVWFGVVGPVISQTHSMKHDRKWKWREIINCDVTNLTLFVNLILEDCCIVSSHLGGATTPQAAYYCFNAAVWFGVLVPMISWTQSIEHYRSMKESETSKGQMTWNHILWCYQSHIVRKLGTL